jgi:hypothetical protein
MLRFSFSSHSTTKIHIAVYLQLAQGYTTDTECDAVFMTSKYTRAYMKEWTD